jgi:hypothetical protein
MNTHLRYWLTLGAAVIIAGYSSTGYAETQGGTITVPKTGQTTCYDSAGNELSSANSGQDGELQKGSAWPQPRFIANADMTITDMLTGLVWAPNGNLLRTRDPRWESQKFDGAVTWQVALAYVAKLNAEKYLGHNDWRLPNLLELRSLANYDRSNTAMWLNSQGFTNAQAGDYYWSSTSYVDDPYKAWVVDLFYGYEHTFDKATYHCVWPVRAGR